MYAVRQSARKDEEGGAVREEVGMSLNFGYYCDLFECLSHNELA